MYEMYDSCVSFFHKCVKSNARNRKQENVPDSFDGQLLWILLRHIRHRERVRVSNIYRHFCRYQIGYNSIVFSRIFIRVTDSRIQIETKMMTMIITSMIPRWTLRPKIAIISRKAATLEEYSVLRLKVVA